MQTFEELVRHTPRQWIVNGILTKDDRQVVFPRRFGMRREPWTRRSHRQKLNPEEPKQPNGGGATDGRSVLPSGSLGARELTRNSKELVCSLLFKLPKWFEKLRNMYLNISEME